VDAARRRLGAGAGTRTDIDEAQARLDLALARELEAGENVGFTRRQLQQLTGLANGPLVPLDTARLPLLPPEPADIDSWIARAEQGSHEMRALQAQRGGRPAGSEQAAGRPPSHARRGRAEGEFAVGQPHPAWASSTTRSRSAWNSMFPCSQAAT
jgi:outer membrane protein/protease secretion system outer membrane protein